MDVHGNRGKCAQPCRLPYELLEENNVIDNGFLLSPRDLCSLEYLPELMKLGVNSFKIEGRMKTPEYVATVTRIYRKYINKILNNEEYIIEEKDKKDLLQVFNRGGFSSGHLLQEENKNLVFKDKSNNIGLYLGNISNYNATKGHITLKLNENLNIGDTIMVEGTSGKYTISELMIKDKNVKEANISDIVKFGRMQGNIRIGAKVFKLSDRKLIDSALVSCNPSSKQKVIPICGSLSVKKNMPISITLTCNNNPPFYNNIDLAVHSRLGSLSEGYCQALDMIVNFLAMSYSLLPHKNDYSCFSMPRQ